MHKVLSYAKSHDKYTEVFHTCSTCACFLVNMLNMHTVLMYVLVVFFFCTFFHLLSSSDLFSHAAHTPTHSRGHKHTADLITPDRMVQRLSKACLTPHHRHFIVIRSAYAKKEMTCTVCG